MLEPPPGDIVLFLDDEIRVASHVRNHGDPENRRLLDRDPASHAWYVAFFHNHVCGDLKDAPRPQLGGRWWRLYRAHVLHGANLAEGPAILARRHAAFARGVAAGVGTRACRPQAGVARRD